MDLLAVREEKVKGMLLPRCSFCAQVPAEGIHGGLKLKHLFICRECEREILALEVGMPAYDTLMKKIKQLFKI